MKSVILITQEMDEIQVSISTGELEQVKINKLKKKYAFLMVCKMYLENKPTIEFLTKERDRLINRMNLINAQYVPSESLLQAGLRKQEQAEHVEYNKMMGLPKIKEQLKSITFLLS